MNLIELKKNYDAAYALALEKIRRQGSEESKNINADIHIAMNEWRNMNIELVPYVSFEKKAETIYRILETLLNEQDGMLTYEPIEKDVIALMSIVNLYTDIEYEVIGNEDNQEDRQEEKKEGGLAPIEAYDLIMSMGLDQWFKYGCNKASDDINLFLDWLGDVIDRKMSEVNDIGPVLNRRLSSIEDVIVGAVESIGSKLDGMDMSAEKVEELGGMLQRINESVNEVQGVVGENSNV